MIRLLCLILSLAPAWAWGKTCEEQLSVLGGQVSAAKSRIKPRLKKVREIEALLGLQQSAQAQSLRQMVGRDIVEQSVAIAGRALDEVIIYRHFNTAMLRYLADQDIRPKSMLPIKSADRGLLAGLVPYDIRRSKLGASLSGRQEVAGQREIDRLIKAGVLRKVPLVSRLGRAVVRHGQEVWTRELAVGDEVLFILTDSAGRRLVSDIDLFDVGRKRPMGLEPQWSDNQGWVTAEDLKTLETINLIFKKLHPGLGSPDLVPHGLEMRRPDSHLVDFPLHAFIPDVGKVKIKEGPPHDRFRYLRAFVQYCLLEGYFFSPPLMRLLGFT